jgi:D-arabinitol 2-dehydrogenase
MFKQVAVRLASRACNSSVATTFSIPLLQRTIARTSRSISYTPNLYAKAADDKYHQTSTAAEPGAGGNHEGSASRTDNQIKIEYPDDKDFPKSQVVQGRGGFHMKRTLPSFSMEGRVAVVTGGARGLGLVMGQALIDSGADLAIVDLNSSSTPRSSFRMTRSLLTSIQKRKANVKPKS